MIDKEFVPYEPALELKEIGFDEPCLAYYERGKELVIQECEVTDFHFDSLQCVAPTFSQAFRFFREKYGYLHHIIYFDPVKAQTPGKADYQGAVLFPHQEIYYLPKESYNTYEEAELACLVKLIQIIKDGKVQTN